MLRIFAFPFLAWLAFSTHATDQGIAQDTFREFANIVASSSDSRRRETVILLGACRFEVRTDSFNNSGQLSDRSIQRLDLTTMDSNRVQREGDYVWAYAYKDKRTIQVANEAYAGNSYFLDMRKDKSNTCSATKCIWDNRQNDYNIANIQARRSVVKAAKLLKAMIGQCGGAQSRNAQSYKWLKNSSSTDFHGECINGHSFSGSKDQSGYFTVSSRGKSDFSKDLNGLIFMLCGG